MHIKINRDNLYSKKATTIRVSKFQFTFLFKKTQMTHFNLFSKIFFNICLFFGIISFCSTSEAQITTNKQLSKEELKTIFTTERKANLGIHYPIFRVYTYSDSEGKFYIVLAENPSKTENGKDASNKIQETYIKYKNGNYTKIFETNDQLRANQYESSIWFWTKHIALEDYDGDGIADPILAYGSFGLNNFDDGRIHFIIHYKGEKIMIHHQNSPMDDERNTKVDDAFYILPSKIQNKVKEIMSNMEQNEQAIFPAGWIEAMGNKKLYFDEN